MKEEVGYNKNTLLEMLRSREVEIKFRKQDGEIRHMRATLSDELIPAHVGTKKDGVREPNMDSLRKNQNVITVWDLDVLGWRSFHPESVLEVL